MSGRGRLCVAGVLVSFAAIAYYLTTLPFSHTPRPHIVATHGVSLSPPAHILTLSLPLTDSDSARAYEARLTAMAASGQCAKAAALALFHGDLSRAIRALRGKESSKELRLVAMSLAGPLAMCLMVCVCVGCRVCRVCVGVYLVSRTWTRVISSRLFAPSPSHAVAGFQSELSATDDRYAVALVTCLMVR